MQCLICWQTLVYNCYKNFLFNFMIYQLAYIVYDNILNIWYLIYLYVFNMHNYNQDTNIDNILRIYKVFILL